METKATEIDKNLEKVKELRQSGKKWTEVADILGVSIATAKRYEKRIKEAENEQ